MSASGVIQAMFVEARPLTEKDFLFLTGEERIRADRFRFDGDRELFVMARCLARTVLGTALGVEPLAVQFAVGTYGKPELAGGLAQSGVSFNWAHSGRQIGFAWSRDRRRVGVDVERLRVGSDWLSLARRFFCAQEIAELERAETPDELTRLFFRYWTLKEAYIKAEGSGLHINLTTVDTSGCPTGGMFKLFEFAVQPVEAAEGYAAAVAADQAPWVAQVQRFTSVEWAKAMGCATQG